MSHPPLAKLEISRDVIESILTQQVSSSVVQALGGSNDLVAKAVSAVLLQQVDSQGKATQSSYDNQGTLLQFTMTSMIKKMLVEILQKMLLDRRAELEVMMVDAIKKQSKTMAAAFVTALADGANREWKFNVTIDPPKRDR